MNEKLNNALELLNNYNNHLWDEEKEVKSAIKNLLLPCGRGGCSIGTEDYADDIFYIYAEPEPNKFDRVMAIRYFMDELQVLLDEGGDWIDFEKAHISDYRFLIDEISCNLEYADGYQDTDVEDEFEFLIDEDGSKYNPETSILNGGMDIRCDYNEEALFAYKTRKSLPEITAYLLSKGWVKTHENTYHEFRKGNTACFFDDWREDIKEFICFGTEYKPGEEAPKEEKRPMKRYAVPFLRTQWADVYVDAHDPEEAIKTAEAIFNESRDGWIDWEDIDCPEYDEARGVEEQKN